MISEHEATFELMEGRERRHKKRDKSRGIELVLLVLVV